MVQSFANLFAVFKKKVNLSSNAFVNSLSRSHLRVLQELLPAECAQVREAQLPQGGQLSDWLCDAQVLHQGRRTQATPPPYIVGSPNFISSQPLHCTIFSGWHAVKWLQWNDPMIKRCLKTKRISLSVSPQQVLLHRHETGADLQQAGARIRRLLLFKLLRSWRQWPVWRWINQCFNTPPQTLQHWEVAWPWNSKSARQVLNASLSKRRGKWSCRTGRYD